MKNFINVTISCHADLIDGYFVVPEDVFMCTYVKFGEEFYYDKQMIKHIENLSTVHPYEIFTPGRLFPEHSLKFSLDEKNYYYSAGVYRSDDGMINCMFSSQQEATKYSIIPVDAGAPECLSDVVKSVKKKINKVIIHLYMCSTLAPYYSENINNYYDNIFHINVADLKKSLLSAGRWKKSSRLKKIKKLKHKELLLEIWLAILEVNVNSYTGSYSYWMELLSIVDIPDCLTI